MSGNQDDRSMSRCTLVSLLVFVILLMAGLIAGIVVGISRDDIGLKKDRHGKLLPAPTMGPMDGPAVPGPNDYWWRSGHEEYQYAAVAADDEQCSEVGTEIMAKEGGTAVDAAIATMFCLGVVNPVASGIGGGMLMTVYQRRNNASRTSSREAWMVNARETAPAAATPDMFVGDDAPSSVRNGMSIAVPGEVKGLYEAWVRFGRVPWVHLVEPAVKLARYGYKVSPYLAAFIKIRSDMISGNDAMKTVFMPEGKALVEGDTGIRPLLANTLEKIAHNPMAFYDPNNELCQNITADIQDAGGIITTQDLAGYEAVMGVPMSISIDDQFTLLTQPPPSSGAILGAILKTLRWYNFTDEHVSTVDNATETYHRIIETFKLAFAERSKLGDVDNSIVLDELLSDAGIAQMRSRINETMTQPLDYYNAEYSDIELTKDMNDLGTNHLSVFRSEGGAVALTSSINYDFGSMVLGKKTGIIFNDHMDDFGVPNKTDVWGLPAAPNNLIAPGKRPMSSMSPSIVLKNNEKETLKDEEEENVVLVTGATGGSKIITTIALSIIKSLWFGWDAQQVVDDPRIHHQLVPEEVEKEEGFSRAILYGLEEKGHNVSTEYISGVYVTTNQLIKNMCGLCSPNETKCQDECRIQAVSDGRRQASPGGY